MTRSKLRFKVFKKEVVLQDHGLISQTHVGTEVFSAGFSDLQMKESAQVS